jgi:hypothetical protein
MFSVFNKGIGKATQFAQSHIFPAMKTTLKTDFMAARAGIRSVGRGIQESYINNMFTGGLPGMALETGSIARKGFNRTMRAYRGAGISQRAGMVRMGTYGAVGIGGMWGLSGD